MAQTAVQNFYRTHATIYDWTRWAILHGRAEAVRRMELSPGSCALEVGCGTGLNFRLLLNQLPQGQGNLTALDFSQDMLRVARKRVEAMRRPDVELVAADASTMRLGKTFDAILFAYSLTMIPDWVGALDRAVEHLKPGGRLVVLDFGRFRGWGPFGGLMRGWLRANHVETLGPYEEKLRERFANLHVTYWLGGYNFTATGRKAD